MNEFIEQFLLESREHIELASADLLELEKSPDNKELLDGIFRAFHTLKGGAGIVEFTAMVDATHTAEDALAAARSGERRITTQIISHCLTCLDQVGRWLNEMQATGELPPGAGAQSKDIVTLFAATGNIGVAAGARQLQSQTERWTEALLVKHPLLRGKSATALRYSPDPQCFFDHEDPVARVAGLPGVIAIEVEAAEPWPRVEDLDPFICNVIIKALAQSSVGEVSTAMAGVTDQCEIVALDGAETRGDGMSLSEPARRVLDAQIALIQVAGAHGMSARMASAGIVAVNVLRHARRVEEAERMAGRVAIALAENNASLLQEAIASALGTGNGGDRERASPIDSGAARMLRVDASRIDALVDVTGELTVAKNAIGHIAKLAEAGDPAAAGLLKHGYEVLDRLVGEVQRSVLSMRVLPLRHVFQRLPRLLREIGSANERPAELVIEGGETEADKAIVEMLFEPLMHVMRNAMDHGVEDAATRLARGKPRVATLILRAARAGDHVVVEVRDDGGGIDLDRVRKVALERNLFDDETLKELSNEEVVNMIFQPGFSTASRVTGVSGRGVGMDAVRTSVQRVGGTVDIESLHGQGTTVRFTLPFSVMMMHVMVVGSGGQAFGIPLEAVVETLRVEANTIVPVGRAHAMVLRNRTIPVVVLADALGLPWEASNISHATVVVTKCNGSYGALRVDRIGERMDVMLKPLEGLLAGVHGLAGSCLLGDGAVLLILDVGELLR